MSYLFQESDPEKLHRGALLLGGASGNISHFRPDLFFFFQLFFMVVKCT